MNAFSVRVAVDNCICYVLGCKNRRLHMYVGILRVMKHARNLHLVDTSAQVKAAA